MSTLEVEKIPGVGVSAKNEFYVVADGSGCGTTFRVVNVTDEGAKFVTGSLASDYGFYYRKSDAQTDFPQAG